MEKLRKIRIPATTANLGCGYDTFGMALGYYNYIEFAAAEHLELRIIGEGAQHLPTSEQNLILRSVKAAYELAGQGQPQLRIVCHNRIPLSRGMGSSSSAIVGGIVAANLLMGGPLDEDALLKLAVKIEGHADNVAPALLGGFTIIANEGGRQYVKKIATPATLRMVLAVPDFHVSTKKARSIMPKQVALEDAVYNIGHAAYLAAALATGDLSGFGAMLYDRIHQPYRFQLVAGAQDVVEAAVAAGALGCVLSGSGPTMIAFSDDDPRLAENIGAAMQEAFAGHDVKAKIFNLTSDNQGTVELNDADAIDGGEQAWQS